MVKRLIVRSVLLAVMASGALGDADSWRPIQGRTAEYRWIYPAKNACEIQFRDLHAEGKTVLMVTISYYAHRNHKNAMNKENDQVVIGPDTEDKIHIFGCESVALVELEPAKTQSATGSD